MGNRERGTGQAFIPTSVSILLRSPHFLHSPSLPSFLHPPPNMSNLTPAQLQQLNAQIESLDLAAVSPDCRTLCICAALNRPEAPPAIAEVRHQLKPVDLFTLVAEGLLSAAQLQQATEHPLTSSLVQQLLQQGDGSATKVTTSIKALVRAARLAEIASEGELQACLDRLDLETVKAADDAANLPEAQKRYLSETVHVPQPPVSWAQLNLGRAIEGADVEAALGG